MQVKPQLLIFLSYDIRFLNRLKLDFLAIGSLKFPIDTAFSFDKI